MKHTLKGILLAGAICAFGLAAPAVAQVAGNPGDLHSPTVYTSEYHAQTHGYAPGYGGPLGPLGVLDRSDHGSPIAAMSGGFARRRRLRGQSRLQRQVHRPLRPVGFFSRSLAGVARKGGANFFAGWVTSPALARSRRKRNQSVRQRCTPQTWAPRIV